MRNRFLLGWAIALILGFCLPPAFGAGGLGEELMPKVMYNEPGEVAALLEEAADVNYRAPDSGSTPLMMAVNRNSMKVVRFLVENGADVNAAAADGSTTLAAAKKKNAQDIVEYLQQHGAR